MSNEVHVCAHGHLTLGVGGNTCPLPYCGETVVSVVPGSEEAWEVADQITEFVSELSYEMTNRYSSFNEWDVFHNQFENDISEIEECLTALKTLRGLVPVPTRRQPAPVDENGPDDVTGWWWETPDEKGGAA